MANNEPIKVGLGGLVNSVPFMAGYEIRDDHVVVVGLEGNLALGVAVTDWRDKGPMRTLASETVDAVDSTLQRAGIREVLIIGYGERAQEQLSWLKSAFEAKGTLAVHGGIAVENDAFQYTESFAEWTGPHAVQGSVEHEFAYRGVPAPATDRDAAIQRLLPESAPSHGVVSKEEQIKIREALPSAVAREAVRLLHRMSGPGVEASADQMALLSTYMRRDQSVGQVLVASTKGDSAQVDALVQVYRTAPENTRGELATHAGTAHYVKYGHSGEALAILAHGDTSGKLGNSTRVLSTLIERGATPDKVAEAYAPDVIADDLRAADRRTLAERQETRPRAAVPQEFGPVVPGQQVEANGMGAGR